MAEAFSNVPIVILAGGASRRMGPRDKLLEIVAGKPLLRLQAERALQVSNQVWVVLRPERPERLTALEGLSVNRLVAEEAQEGIGGSIRAATQALSDHPKFMLLLADLVNLQPEDLRAMLTATQGSPDAAIWRGTSQDGQPGHPIVFSQPVYPDLLTLSGDVGARGVIQKHARRVAHIPLQFDHAIRDLDTPEDWANWRRERNRGNNI